MTGEGMGASQCSRRRRASGSGRPRATHSPRAELGPARDEPGVDRESRPRSPEDCEYAVLAALTSPTSRDRGWRRRRSGSEDGITESCRPGSRPNRTGATPSKKDGSSAVSRARIALNADGEHARDVLLVVAALFSFTCVWCSTECALVKTLRPSMIKPELVDAFCRLRATAASSWARVCVQNTFTTASNGLVGSRPRPGSPRWSRRGCVHVSRQKVGDAAGRLRAAPRRPSSSSSSSSRSESSIVDCPPRAAIRAPCRHGPAPALGGFRSMPAEIASGSVPVSGPVAVASPPSPLGRVSAVCRTPFVDAARAVFGRSSPRKDSSSSPGARS